MRLGAGWTRRQFVTTAGLAGAATALPAARLKAVLARQPYVLYLTQSLMMPATARHSIETMHVDGGEWTRPLPQGVKIGWAPRAIARHPVLPVLYVSHGQAVDRDGRQRASVTEYEIDGGTGELHAMKTEPLALSSLLARDLAVSPDGRSLLVAGSVGGVYSVLPLREDGGLGAVEHALKMTGGGPRRTLPYLAGVLFHPSGVAYGTDLAMHRMQMISFAEGMPEVASTYTFPENDGPTKMALSPEGDALFVVLRWRPGIAIFPVDRVTGGMRGGPRIQAMDGVAGAAVAVDAAGARVYAATQEGTVTMEAHGGSATLVSVFSRGRKGDELRLIERVRVPEILGATRLLLQRNELLVVGLGGVVAMDVARGTGRLGATRHVVRSGPFSDAAVREL